MSKLCKKERLHKYFAYFPYFIYGDIFARVFHFAPTFRRVVESFPGWVRFSKFREGLPKYYLLNLISDLFQVPGCDICANNDIDHVRNKLFPVL